MLFFAEGIEEEAVRAVFSRLQDHHDALRMVYPGDNSSQFTKGSGIPLSLQVFDYRTHRDAGPLLEAKANEIQVGIDFESGPLMKLGLFQLEDGDRLLIVIHHLVIDGVSWRILLEDIQSLYSQYRSGEPFTLPLKTDSFKVWSEQLATYADSDRFLKEKSYWEQLEKTAEEIPPIPRDFEDTVNLVKDVETFSFSLNPEETRSLLQKTNNAFGTEINDILLTALGSALKNTFGNEKVLIALEGHGREEILGDIDISRTVGWFTSLFPVLLDFLPLPANNPDTSLARRIKEIKETLRRVPHKGIGYGILKYLTSPRHKEGISFKSNPQILFNYLGQFDSDLEQPQFKIAEESSGSAISPHRQRDIDLEVSGIVTGQCLTMSISYGRKQFRLETIRTLSNEFKTQLLHIILFCSRQEKNVPTPSDFSYSHLSIDALELIQTTYPMLIDDIYTMTPMQEGMLFYSLFENENRATYFLQMSYRSEGTMDIEILETSLNQLFKRQDVLRTVFVYEGLDRPVQVVLKERKADFTFEDVRQSVSTQESKDLLIRDFKEKDRAKSFDLTTDTLMRVTLHQLDDDQYQITWSFHHILMDGWCIGILVSQFSEIYLSLLNGEDPQLPPVKPYRTYIQWLESQDKESTRDFWKNYLAGYDEKASIPRSINHDAFEGEYLGAHIGTRLEKEQTAALRKIAIRNHVTLNTLIQIAWAIVLGKYTSSRDVVFGVLISGRPPQIEEVETMVGCFINTIPVRITFEPDTRFNQLLRTVQERAIQSDPHQYYSLAEIQAESSLKQNLLDHIIEFQNYPIAERIEGVGDRVRKSNQTQPLKLSNVSVFEQGNYDFNVVVVPGDRIYISFSYNSSAYDPQMVEQIGFNSIRVLEQVIENDSLEIGEIVLLSEEERKKILFEFNDNKTHFPHDSTVYHFLEKHAEQTPHKVASVGPCQEDSPAATVTYEELNRRSGLLAAMLTERGIGKDESVCILMERSLTMLVSILAVWKAGGAYLPIDTTYPAERIGYILTDSKSRVMLTSGETKPLNKTEMKERVETIIVNHLQFPVSSKVQPSHPGVHAPESLAYIIYTSGSTGKPKGAMVEHIGMMNHMGAKVNDLQLTPDSIVSQNASSHV